MLSQLAQVFSSQGVLIQGTQYASAPARTLSATLACDHKNDCNCFGSKFDQSATKLEWSKEAQAMGAGKAEGSPNEKKTDESSLTEDEKKQVEKLAKRDKEVRAHEQAHLANAGGAAKGGANYEYQTGPDGKAYAVGGHVDIDASPVAGNPEATLQKAQAIQRAALAPADPSGQDRAVAASAAQMAMEAHKEINEAKSKEGGEPNDLKSSDGSQAPESLESVQAVTNEIAESKAVVEGGGSASRSLASAYSRGSTAIGMAFSAYA